MKAFKFTTVEVVKRGEATVSLKGRTRTLFPVKDLRKKLLHYIPEQKIEPGAVFVTRTGKSVSLHLQTLSGSIAALEISSG